jgi:hypothetical protein
MKDKYYKDLLRWDMEKYFQRRITKKAFNFLLKIIENYLVLIFERRI